MSAMFGDCAHRDCMELLKHLLKQSIVLSIHVSCSDKHNQTVDRKRTQASSHRITLRQSQERPADHTARVPSTPPLSRCVGAAAPAGTYNATADMGPSPGFSTNPRSFWLCKAILQLSKRAVLLCMRARR